jgi:glutamine synthetase
VPAWAADEDAMIELRCPDAMANPYLAFAVVLACTLDGIRAAEEPPLPLDQSLGSFDDEELAKLDIPRLPATLDDALAALVEDDILRAALGDYIFEQLLLVKRAEWEDYRRYVSPWEHARYADV